MFCDLTCCYADTLFQSGWSKGIVIKIPFSFKPPFLGFSAFKGMYLAANTQVTTKIL